MWPPPVLLSTATHILFSCICVWPSNTVITKFISERCEVIDKQSWTYKMAGVQVDSLQYHAVCHVFVIWINSLLRQTAFTHVHITRPCQLYPHQATCKTQLINSYTNHGAIAHVLLTDCWCHTTCRRPFPAGDRVTFNGKDCLCQYCVEPMSPGPKDILGSSSK